MKAILSILDAKDPLAFSREQAKSMQGSPAYTESPFKVNDLVMFKSRAQTTGGGMRVEEVDSNMFDIRIKVDGNWWTPGCFISFEEWKRQVAH